MNQTQQFAPLLIEIWSDVVCPWCAIGKARFEKALAQLEPSDRDRFEVVYRAHQLDPTAPPMGSPVFETYAKKFGGPDKAAAIIDRVTGVAAEEGITFRMDRALRANTLLAHRLIGKALAVGGVAMQHAVKQRLLDAYFTEGLDIGDPEVLAGFAVDAGVFGDADGARTFLDSGELRQETLREIADGMELGVTGVPTFVFDRQWSIPGAQDTEVFVRVLRKMVERHRDAVSSEGESCSADGTC